MLLNVYLQLDQQGNRDDLSDMLYYLLNEGEFLIKDRFWSIINQKFSPQTQDKMMTIAQKIEAKGLEKGLEEVAKNLLSEGTDIVFISKVTKLLLEKIEKLKKDLH